MEASKSSLLVFILMGFISASSANVLTVGGGIGWVENPPVPYNNWSGRMRFSVNDTLVFNYKQGDSVLVVTKESYDSCNVTNPLQKLGSGVYKLDHSGLHYFISGAAGHCSNGEKLIVRVLAIRSPPSPPGAAPPAPAPASPPPAPSSVSPAPSSLSPSPASVSAPGPSSLPPSPAPVSAPGPSSLPPSPAPVSAPGPSSSSPSPAPVSAPGPSSSSPAPASVSAPGPSVSPIPSSLSPPSPTPAGSVPPGAPSGSVASPPPTQHGSSPVLRISFGLVALVLGSTLMI